MAKKAYFGLGWFLSVIFAIIPFTNWLFGIITRIERESYLLAVLNIILAPLFWVVDLVSILVNKDIKWLV